MKKLGIICLMFFVGSVFAQQPLAGPKAKNINVWDRKKKVTVLNVKGIVNPELRSLELKNLRPWNRVVTSDLKVTIGNRKMHDLQGPERKNYYPWQK
ncbi:MAG: hypothetical protein GW772_04155 [Flavobacteriia bacterium]|nr:hypothetical protein [Flavobacteriia bacterium]OIP45190.1 MAG: hypothetical protein AUK46_12785 [Flavobacteriaceae bacterium CG2_30_31_66]PIV97560.1 MAG: hypothetical protein COW43_02795 [Flavobacteriaceae bacterium CG17_big_fil_post_rev_8_21_14_2_50_31_13]PIX12929.1 MAG: hypothetical protein COZ74_08920 [Flavobacteriaceae bacterium CG_4_8_14_3_um_filter_31_8]PIY14679.1 MAG: hypothetical protein COZ16_08015 [Flavobacteriaceae bacterium CG_4_10_14_3_um_filter_31_253]PIZ10090.1 MAG: hypotheti